MKQFLILGVVLVVLACPARAEIMVETAFSPHQGATALIIKTIERAQKTIRVAAYSFTSRPIANALITATRRGVDVKIVVDQGENFAHGASPWLVAHGVAVRRNGHYAILHDKFMIIDDAYLQLGSFNYTYAAENNNAENVIVISGSRNLVDRYCGQWQKFWDEAKNM